MLTKKDKERMLASMPTQLTLGELLFDWRTKARLSKTDAGLRCGLSPQHWWNLENDRRPNPEIETLEKLVIGTGIALDTLLVAGAHTRKVRQVQRLEPLTV